MARQKFVTVTIDEDTRGWLDGAARSAGVTTTRAARELVEWALERWEGPGPGGRAPRWSEGDQVRVGVSPELRARVEREAEGRGLDLSALLWSALDWARRREARALGHLRRVPVELNAADFERIERLAEARGVSPERWVELALAPALP